jgi:hypothetical protein
MSKPDLLITLEGGAVQCVESLNEPIDYVLVDYDTEGSDPAEITNLSQDQGGSAPALVYVGATEVVRSDLPRVEDLERFIENWLAHSMGTDYKPETIA